MLTQHFARQYMQHTLVDAVSSGNSPKHVLYIVVKSGGLVAYLLKHDNSMYEY